MLNAYKERLFISCVYHYRAYLSSQSLYRLLALTLATTTINHNASLTYQSSVLWTNTCLFFKYYSVGERVRKITWSLPT